jgi:hypothetical protein
MTTAAFLSAFIRGFFGAAPKQKRKPMSRSNRSAVDWDNIGE